MECYFVQAFTVGFTLQNAVSVQTSSTPISHQTTQCVLGIEPSNYLVPIRTHFGVVLVCHPQKGIEMPKIICQFIVFGRQNFPFCQMIYEHRQNILVLF